VSDILDPVTRHHIERAAERLAEEFAGIFSRETIARYITESEDLLGETKINVFVPCSSTGSRASASVHWHRPRGS
jgi:protein-tyrosine phosphatase-like protein